MNNFNKGETKMDNLEETNSKNEQEKTSYVLEATPRPMTVADAILT